MNKRSRCYESWKLGFIDAQKARKMKCRDESCSGIRRRNPGLTYIDNLYIMSVKDI